MLQRHTLDALIMGSHSQNTQEYWEEIKRPVVAFDRYLCDSIPTVGLTTFRAGVWLRALIAAGVQHVISSVVLVIVSMIVTAVLNCLTLASLVRALIAPSQPCGYQLVLEDELVTAGIETDYVTVEDLSDLSLFLDVARRAFEDFDNVDAIVAPDLAAAAVLQEAERRSIRVPEDLQVIAYDGTYVSMFAGKLDFRYYSEYR